MGRIISDYTFRLFRDSPSFLEGTVSMLDFSDGTQLYNYDKTEKEADLNSIRADWLAVGNDLKNAIDEYASAFRGKES